MLSLRPITEPSPNYIAWMNDPEVIRYLETRFQVHTRESLAQYIQEQNSNSNVVLRGIFFENAHIGNIRLGPINWVHRHAEIGLVIAKTFWGMGYGTEAIKLISDYAFDMLDLHKLIAGAYNVNVGSIRAFEKAGFEIEGRIRNMYHTREGRTGRIILGKSRMVKRIIPEFTKTKEN